MKLETVLLKEKLNRNDLTYLLNLEKEEELEKLFARAYEVKSEYIGKKVYYRGLIEFSNKCIKNCFYCGIRRDNGEVERFDMTEEQVIEQAKWAYENNYGSLALQSGERQDADYIQFVDNILEKVKELSGGKLGITLSLGEQSYETYKRWYDLGAHRYLLRIESSNKDIYSKLHPEDELHSFEKRVECLKMLKEIGYQVGTGVMIGLPGQTVEDLADDILFYEKMDIDMIGMGPYIPHDDTPMGRGIADSKEESDRKFKLGLKMIAVARIYLKDVNIAATTALQAINPLGREKGLKAGANILMPIITVDEHRAKYQLYNNKPCIDDNADKCKNCLAGRVTSVGDEIMYGEWGDSPHYYKKKG